MKPRLFGIMVILLLTSGAVVWLALRPGPLRRGLVRWFGPPAVEMREAYVSPAGSSIFEHGDLDRLLHGFVDDEGWVDYRALAERREELRDYMTELAAADFESLGRDEKLAFLINAYNAFTLELILDHYPIDSIRDIPSAERWNAERWTIGGETLSLNQIEHERIRPMFREPRIHFALVCAAAGCPPLRSEAYVGERLEAQLEAQARRVHADARWIRYEGDARRIEVTSLYEWYADDFEQVAGSILEYAAPYRDDLARDLSSGHLPAVRFLPYDWSLNDRGRAD